MTNSEGGTTTGGRSKVKEVAAYLQISKDLIYKWAQQGKIPVPKIGNQWRFKREEIDKWAEAQRPKTRIKDKQKIERE